MPTRPCRCCTESWMPSVMTRQQGHKVDTESTLLHRLTAVSCKEICAQWGSNSTGSICCWHIVQTSLQQIHNKWTNGAWAFVYNITRIYHLQIIFRAVIVAKLMYGSSTWWGFASAADRQKVKAFIQHCTRAGFYTPDPHYDFQELCNEADHRLFNKILESQYHVLEQLLPPTLPQSYDFRNGRIPDRSQTAVLV